MRRTLVAALVGMTSSSCERTPGDSATAGGPPLLADVTASLGLPSTSTAWPDGRYAIPEISPGGVALFDYDSDGDLDIYQVVHPSPDRPDAPTPNRLYAQGRGGKFTKVEGAAGLDDPGYGNGVAVGDVDSDGDVDVYVANLGQDALYVNDGSGKFHRADDAGIDGALWSTCAAFLDHDRDGDLDLYVSHYLVDDPTKICRTGVEERRDYCGPSRYQGVADTLYRNDGATFVDVSEAAGLSQAWPGFAVVCVDLTGDGWVDIYVANDMRPNQLYVNRRDGTFVDEALERGVALNGAGRAEASMGIAVGDVDSDGRLDLFLTHLADQTNTLYLSGDAGNGRFRDRSASSGLGAPSLRSTGWGCGFADLDHDGDLDLALVNGRIARGPRDPAAKLGDFWSDYAERDQLFLDRGGGRFVDASPRGGEFCSRLDVGRSLALGDLDGDGDLDLVTSHVDNSLRVFRNDAPPPGAHWITVRARTRARDALGAVVTIEASGREQIRPIVSAYSFAAASDPAAHFGLGGATSVDRVEVLWPDGRLEDFGPHGVDRVVTLEQGKGGRRGSP